jgi:hypothetical protein
LQKQQERQDLSCNLSPEWKAAAEAQISAARRAAAGAVTAASHDALGAHYTVEGVRTEASVDGPTTADEGATCLRQFSLHANLEADKGALAADPPHNLEAVITDQALTHQPMVYQGFPISKEAISSMGNQEQSLGVEAPAPKRDAVGEGCHA